MKITRFFCLFLALVMFTGCARVHHSSTEPPSESVHQSTEAHLAEAPIKETTLPTEETVQVTEPPSTKPASENHGKTNSSNNVPSWTKPKSDNANEDASETEEAAEQDPPSTEAPESEPPATRETTPEPPETQPPETLPPETPPAETEAAQTEPPTTEGTEPPATEEPEVTEITYEFKRQVAAYAAQYINQYRGSPCTVLSGMSQVAQYRASQLTWNYGHSTADKRAALAAFEYGRYIDATEFGDDASNSYWEADSAEAICAGFYGTDAEAMGKQIANLIRNSSGHWNYISSSQYSYIGIGVEYREGSEYGWYCCVMVGSVDYG